MQHVRFEIERGGIAVITLDNPPANGLSRAVREGLQEAFLRVRNDGSIRAAVLQGAGRLFCAGAEIRELGTADATAPPGLSSHVHATMEMCGKPVVAALHGAAVGGGLETALVCHYRVAHAATKIALPETKLGLIPLSGTQRLPRLAGLRFAIEMIVFGAGGTAAEYDGSGLFDRIVPANDGDVLAAALTVARHTIGAPEPPPLARHRAIADHDRRRVLDEARARLHSAHASRAQFAALEAIAAGAQADDFDAGLAQARVIFDALMDSDEVRAARAAFLASRAAAGRQ